MEGVINKFILFGDFNIAFAVYVIAVTFLFGISIGSFLNVLIYRLPLGLNPVKGRSFCPNCKTSLKPKDLVPLFSCLFLKFKCRYCGKPISPRYFTVELITGILYSLIVMRYGLNSISFLNILSLSLLLVIAYIDYDNLKIPNYLLILLLAVNLFGAVILQAREIREIVLAPIIFSFLLLVSSLLAKSMGRGEFGFGDVKLAFIIGINVEIKAIFIFLFLTMFLLGFKLVGELFCAKFVVRKRDIRAFALAPVLVTAGIIYMFL